MAGREPAVEPLDLSGCSTPELFSAYAQVKTEREAAETLFKQRVGVANRYLEAFKIEINRRHNDPELSIEASSNTTGFRVPVTFYSTPSWPDFYEYVANRIKEGDNPAEVLGLFAKKLSTERCSAWIESHGGHLPPGLASHSEYDIQIRRK